MKGRVRGKATNKAARPVTVISVGDGVEEPISKSNPVPVSTLTSDEVLRNILIELRFLRLHLEMVTEHVFDVDDIEQLNRICIELQNVNNFE